MPELNKLSKIFEGDNFEYTRAKESPRESQELLIQNK